jgi:UPF0176 protein
MKNPEIILFYNYVTVEDPEALADRERSVLSVLGLKGRLIVAPEGINGTFEGEPEVLAKYIEHLKSDKRFKHTNIKRSEGTGDAFPRLSVKVKPEIVSNKLTKDIAPLAKRGRHLPAHELKKWYTENKDFHIIDMRSDYEVAVGKFDKTIDMNLEASRDLKKSLHKIEHLKDKPVVAVCTGGIKCEKMSAFLVNNGFQDVYQLDQGIHTYMQKYPGEDFKGALYTFDGRKVMHFGGEREIIGVCYKCDAKTERYENCADKRCHKQMLICDSCVEKDQGIYCSDTCKTKVENSSSVHA